jgi:hypothetical protein
LFIELVNFEARIFQLLAEYAHFRTVSRNFCFGHGNGSDRQNASHRQRRRRGIFVEPYSKQNSSPGGAAYSDDVAPERSFGIFGFIGYKDFAPTVLADLPIYPA